MKTLIVFGICWLALASALPPRSPAEFRQLLQRQQKKVVDFDDYDELSSESTTINTNESEEDFTTNFNGTDDIEADEPESDESEEIVVVKPTTTTTTTTQKPSTTERFTDFLKRRKMERYLATTTEDPNMVILGRFTTSTAPSTNVPSGETVPTRSPLKTVIPEQHSSNGVTGTVSTRRFRGRARTPSLKRKESTVGSAPTRRTKVTFPSRRPSKPRSSGFTPKTLSSDSSRITSKKRMIDVNDELDAEQSDEQFPSRRPSKPRSSGFTSKRLSSDSSRITSKKRMIDGNDKLDAEQSDEQDDPPTTTKRSTRSRGSRTYMSNLRRTTETPSTWTTMKTRKTTTSPKIFEEEPLSTTAKSFRRGRSRFQSRT